MKILVAEIINNEVAQVRVTTQDYFSKNPNRYPGEWRIVGEENSEITLSIDCGKKSYFLRDKEKFIEPKPFESWIVDEQKEEWIAPVEKPGENYFWDEKTQSWILISDDDKQDSKSTIGK